MSKSKDSTGIFRADITMETELTHLVLAKNAGHAMDKIEEADASDFETVSCTWLLNSIKELTREEVMENATHTVHLKPTQEQLYRQAERLSAECNQVFMEMIKGEHAITKKELRALIAKRPSLWGRYSAYLETDTLREE